VPRIDALGSMIMTKQNSSGFAAVQLAAILPDTRPTSMINPSALLGGGTRVAKEARA